MTKDEELRLEQEISRGLNAEAILKNPEYKTAMLSIRGELMRTFEQTKFKDSADRDEIWRKMQIINWFESRLEKVLRNGEHAKKTLAQRLKEKTHQLFQRSA